MTVRRSKSKDVHRKRGRNHKAIRCFGAMITPRRGLIFAQGAAIQQACREILKSVSDDQTKSARA